MIAAKLSIEKLSIQKGAQLVTTRQIKAARALLGWSQGDLAQHSSISEPTIARLESVDGPIAGRPKTADKIRSALEKASIQLIDKNGGGSGDVITTRTRAKP